jgi:hypothetical protein
MASASGGEDSTALAGGRRRLGATKYRRHEKRFIRDLRGRRRETPVADLLYLGVVEDFKRGGATGVRGRVYSAAGRLGGVLRRQVESA